MNDERPLSPYYNLDSILSSLTESDNYDKDIEIFWYGFKESIKNFLKNREELRCIVCDKLYSDSQYLNELKDKKQYSEIMKVITSRIEEYIYLIMKYKSDHYHTNILFTNTKRWHNILDQFDKKCYYINNNYLIFISVYNKLVKKISIHEHSDILNYLENVRIDDIDKLHNIESMVDILIKYKIPAALDKIIESTDISNHVKRKYGITIFKKTKAGKLLSQIKNSNDY